MVRRSEEIERLREQYDATNVGSKKSVLAQLATEMLWSNAGDYLKGIAEDDASLRDFSCGLLRQWHDLTPVNTERLEQHDKAYVMHVYYSSTFHEDRLPDDIQNILKEIPFLFGENG